MRGEQVGHLLIELLEMILDHAQFFECQLQQPAIHRICAQGDIEKFTS